MRKASCILAGFFMMLLVCLTAPWPAARAEVSAQVDWEGNYLRMVLQTNGSAKNLRIWSVQRLASDRVPLNPLGDLNGDLWPEIEENPRDRNHPWVVWSRFDGEEYDLAWSRWQARAWTPTEWVLPQSAGVGDDLDPDVVFDSTGRPFMVWWRDEEAGGRVYLTLFLETRWMTAWPVSDAGQDSRYPKITLESDNRIRVDYLTPDGPVTRWVVFSRPDSITDNLDPFGDNTFHQDGARQDELQRR